MSAGTSCNLFGSNQPWTEEATTVNKVAQVLVSGLPLNQALEWILTQIEQLLYVEAGWLLLVDAASGDLVCRFGLGRAKPARQLKASRLSGRPGLIGRVIYQAKPVMMNNITVSNDPNKANLLHHFLGAPLMWGRQVIGVLAVTRQGEDSFDRNELSLLGSMTAYVTIALAQAGLQERLWLERERVVAAQEQTRRSLARELHDGPAQLISGIRMRLDFCRKASERDPALLTKELPHLESLADQANHEIRTALLGLRPLVLETEGLAAGLQTWLERRQAEISRTRLSFKLKTGQKRFSRLETEVEAALFAIAQEAVNNALKHAQADQVSVFLKETPTAIYLIIIDDGGGFEVEEIRRSYGQRGSWGLLNLQERAELIGGTFTLHSKPGHGTHITVYVPKAREDCLKRGEMTGRLIEVRKA